MGNYIGRLVPEGYLTRRELAEYLGCSYDTIIRWEKQDLLTPAATMENGKVETHLFAKTQPEIIRIIERMKA